MLADEANPTAAPSESTSPVSLAPHPPCSLLVRSGVNSGKAATRRFTTSPAATLPTSSPTAATEASPRVVSPTASDHGTASTAPMERVLQTGQPTFSTKLDFLTVNRTVAALERAVERLELLSLLDATGPAMATKSGSPAAATSATKTNAVGTTNSSDGAAAAAASFAAASTRGAAVLTGADHDASLITAQKVSEALAASQQQGSRGRPSVLELLSEQRLLERRYGELLVQTQPVVSLHPGEPQLRKQCFGNVQDAQQTALQQELAQVSARLRDTNRLLCTQLQDNPQDADNWAKVSNERRELTALLKEVIAELTMGYKEVFQHHQQRPRKGENGSSCGAGSHNNDNRLSSVNVQRSHAANDVGGSGGDNSATDPSAAHSIAAAATTSATAHTSSRLSSAAGGGANSETGSQQTALRRFGSTMQRRRMSRSTHQGPRFPLASSYHEFAVKVLQEEAARQWADGVLAKERALNQNVKQLQADLVRERELKEKDVAERKARVSELQLELRRLKAAMQQRAEAAKARGEAAMEGLQRDGAAEINDVRQSAQHNERLLTVEADTHSAFAEFVQRRTAVTDTLANEWEAKTQRELKKKEAAKIDAESSRKNCAQRLADLQQEQSVQLELKKQREAKTKAEEEERQRAADQRAMEYTAASVLEAALKAMMTRQTLAKQKKGSKKKKKT